MKIGQRVHLKFYPSSWGTVSKVNGDRFQVTWHSPGRPSGRPRLRFWYGPDSGVLPTQYPKLSDAI